MIRLGVRPNHVILYQTLVRCLETLKLHPFCYNFFFFAMVFNCSLYFMQPGVWKPMELGRVIVQVLRIGEKTSMNGRNCPKTRIKRVFEVLGQIPSGCRVLKMRLFCFTGRFWVLYPYPNYPNPNSSILKRVRQGKGWLTPNPNFSDQKLPDQIYPIILSPSNLIDNWSIQIDDQVRANPSPLSISSVSSVSVLVVLPLSHY